jgi:LacI family transcriptional regulator
MNETTMSDGDDADLGRPTMRHVAALAGVSLKTVSRVINAEPNVSPDLVEKVARAAKQLGYVPNMGARSLRRSDRRTSTIGLLLADVSNAFSAVLLRTVEDIARPRGVSVIAASLDEDENRERALVHEFVSRRVDGLMLTPVGADLSYVVQHQRAGLPVVCLDRPAVGLNADTVLMDNQAAARLGVEHLIAHGHRRIAYLGHQGYIYTSIQRLNGYRAAMHAAGLSVEDELCRLGNGDETYGHDATLAVLDADEPPTAIFAARNAITMGVVRALAERNLSTTVAVLGFDDFPLADLLTPPVSVISQDVPTMSTKAAEMLFARIEGDSAPTRHITLEPSLIQRGTGEIAPSANPSRGRRSTRRSA